MILPVVKYGSPVLRQKGVKIEAITPEIKQLIADMFETMEENNGVGLAAQQVGVPIQLAVIDVADVEDRPSTLRVDGADVNLAEYMPLILLNPKLELGAEKEAGTEGCLSFPEITAEIFRSASVKAKAHTLDGDVLEFEATGLLARALQHEVDHLHGVLFIDRMNSATRTTVAGKLKRLQRESKLD